MTLCVILGISMEWPFWACHPKMFKLWRCLEIEEKWLGDIISKFQLNSWNCLLKFKSWYPSKSDIFALCNQKMHFMQILKMLKYCFMLINDLAISIWNVDNLAKFCLSTFCWNSGTIWIYLVTCWYGLSDEL